MPGSISPTQVELGNNTTALIIKGNERIFSAHPRI